MVVQFCIWKKSQTEKSDFSTKRTFFQINATIFSRKFLKTIRRSLSIVQFSRKDIQIFAFFPFVLCIRVLFAECQCQDGRIYSSIFLINLTVSQWMTLH